jgi:hypothetical protein
MQAVCAKVCQPLALGQTPLTRHMELQVFLQCLILVEH